MSESGVSESTTVTRPSEETTGEGLDPRRRTVLVVGAIVVAIALSLVFRAVYISNQASWMYDMLVFRKAGQRVLDGQTIYWQTPRSLFTHTPFNALFCVLLVLPSLTVVAVVWNALTLFCLQVLTWLTLGLAGVNSVRVRAAIAVAVAVLSLRFDPLAMDLLLGQTNTLCVLLLVVDLILLRNSRWQGVITGVLAGIYLAPGLFVVFLLVSRRFRAVAMAVVGFAVPTAIGFAALPSDSVTYWRGLFLDSTRVGSLQNPRAQSVSDVLARFLHTSHLGFWSPVLVVLISAAGVALAWWLGRAGEWVAAVMVCGLASLLATPVSWNHNFVWVVPPLLLLGVAAVRRRSGWLAALVVVSVANFLVAPYTLGLPVTSAADLHLTVAQSLLACTYAVNALVLLVVFAVPRLTGENANAPLVVTTART